MQVGIDVTCMYTNFGGCVSLVSEILLLSKMSKFPFLTMDYSPWQAWVKYMTIVFNYNYKFLEKVQLYKY